MPAGYVECGPKIGGRRSKEKPKDPGKVPRVTYREGWLQKKKRNDGMFSNWNRRFFRIDCDARKLGYFHSKDDAEAGKFPTGSISLTSITAVRVHAGTEFQVESKERNFTLKADSENDALQWFNTIEGYRRKLKAYVAAKRQYEQQLRQDLKERQQRAVEGDSGGAGGSIAAAAAAAAAASLTVVEQATETSGQAEACKAKGKAPGKRQEAAPKAKGGLKRGTGLKTSPRRSLGGAGGTKAKVSAGETKQQGARSKQKEEALKKTQEEKKKKKKMEEEKEKEKKTKTKAKKTTLVRGGGIKVGHEETKKEGAQPKGGGGDAPKSPGFAQDQAEADGASKSPAHTQESAPTRSRDFSGHQKAWATPPKSPLRRGSGLAIKMDRAEEKISVEAKEHTEEADQAEGGEDDDDEEEAEDDAPPPPPPPGEGTIAKGANAREAYAALATKKE